MSLLDELCLSPKEIVPNQMPMPDHVDVALWFASVRSNSTLHKTFAGCGMCVCLAHVAFKARHVRRVDLSSEGSYIALRILDAPRYLSNCFICKSFQFHAFEVLKFGLSRAKRASATSSVVASTLRLSSALRLLLTKRPASLFTFVAKNENEIIFQKLNITNISDRPRSHFYRFEDLKCFAFHEISRNIMRNSTKKYQKIPKKPYFLRMFYSIKYNKTVENIVYITYFQRFNFGSGKRGSNPRPSAWEADALPTELLPRDVGIETVNVNT